MRRKLRVRCPAAFRDQDFFFDGAAAGSLPGEKWL
jgi:hypothetical protein